MSHARYSFARHLLAACLTLAIFVRPARSQDTTAFTRARADTVHAQRAKEIWSGSRTPVLLSFSGGISLGAYQAGVNWVMLELIKSSHYPAQVGSLSRLYPLDAVPDIPVTAMSGASAGNINVLLASVTYCDPRLDQSAEESLFWKMWVQSGWDELFPDHRIGHDPGALDRSVSMARVRQSLDSTMRTVHFSAQCTMPLGVSVTRVRPVTMPLDVNLSYQTQRMAALFTAEEAAGHLRFVRQSSELLRAGGIGAQIVLPSRDSREVSLDDVFSVVMASSSYPIAFAPVRVAYQTPGCALTPTCQAVDTAKFMDGGVFDNNPVSLVVDMGDAIRHGATTGGLMRTRVWFVDPGAARAGSRFNKRVHDLDSLSAHADTVDHNGVAALLSFVGGFIPASRQYELQSFARTQAVLQPEQQAAIRSSTRSHPVIGEHLNAFAAFLGTPFREFDFYVGVADGMRFVAAEILCRERMPWRLDPTLATRVNPSYADSGLANVVFRNVVEQCADRQALRLADSAFSLRPVGRHIVQRVLQRDIGGAPMPSLPVALDAAEGARLTVLDALEESTFAKLDAPLPAPGDCHAGQFLTRTLCADGFADVLASMRRHDEAMRILRCDATDIHCQPYPAPVEQTAHVIDDPQGTLDRYLTLALIEMRRTERGEHSSWFRAMKAGEMVYRAADDHSGWSYDGGPSSIPRYDGLWSSLAIFPYFAGTTIGVRGFQFGWQPTLHTPHSGLILEIPFGDVGLPRGVDHSSQVAASLFATPSVGMEFSNGYMNQVALGGRFESVGKIGDGIRGEWLSPEFSTYVLGRVLRFNVYRIPGRMSESGRSRLIWGLSLADVNGLAYWIARIP